MKKIIFLALAGVLCSCSTTRLTPELVIPGGYYKYERINLFPENNRGEVWIVENISCELKAEEIRDNLTKWIVMNNYKIRREEKKRVIFDVVLPVGKDYFYTPAGYFDRVASKLSFLVTVNYEDNAYTRTLENFLTERRKIFKSGTKSSGSPNKLHWERFNYLVNARNDYIDLLIAKRKTLNRLKKGYVVKVENLTAKVESEKELYEVEYEGVLKFLDSIEDGIVSKNRI
jgi:hypothetical protein